MMRPVAAGLVLVGFMTGCSSSPSGPTTGSGGGSGTAVTIVSGASTRSSSAYAPNPLTIIAALTRALQEAMLRIEALEAAG